METKGTPNQAADTGKKVKGRRGAVAMFIRASDGVRIDVFPRPGEDTQHAILRVMRRNGSSSVEHHLTTWP